MYLNGLLEFATSAQEIMMKKSAIPHPGSGLKLCAAPTAGKRVDLGYCYGWQVYADLIREGHMTTTYGERVTEANFRTFRMRANGLPKNIAGKEGLKRC